jgi:hypothetical protein
MTSFANSPKLVKGGIVMIDPETPTAQRIIALLWKSMRACSQHKACVVMAKAPDLRKNLMTNEYN